MKNPALYNLGRLLKVRDEQQLDQLTEEDIVKRLREAAEEHTWTEEDYEDGSYSGLLPDHIGSDADSETKDAFMASCFDVGVLEDEEEEDEDEDEDEVNGPPQQSDDPPKHQGAADADDPPKHQGAADADEQQSDDPPKLQGGADADEISAGGRGGQ